MRSSLIGMGGALVIRLGNNYGYTSGNEFGLRKYVSLKGLKIVFYPVVVGEHRSSLMFRSFFRLRSYLRVRNEIWMYIGNS